MSDAGQLTAGAGFVEAHVGKRSLGTIGSLTGAGKLSRVARIGSSVAALGPDLAVLTEFGAGSFGISRRLDRSVASLGERLQRFAGWPR